MGLTFHLSHDDACLFSSVAVGGGPAELGSGNAGETVVGQEARGFYDWRDYFG